MTVFIVCDSCPAALGILSPKDGLLFGTIARHERGGYVCFRCGAPASLHSEHDGEAITISEEDAFRAINGLGLPGEQECSLAAVRRATYNHKVVRIDGRMIIHSNRCIISKIYMDNGVILHIGSSALGATIYRIEGVADETSSSSV